MLITVKKSFLTNFLEKLAKVFGWKENYIQVTISNNLKKIKRREKIREQSKKFQADFTPVTKGNKKTRKLIRKKRSKPKNKEKSFSEYSASSVAHSSSESNFSSKKLILRGKLDGGLKGKDDIIHSLVKQIVEMQGMSNSQKKDMLVNILLTDNEIYNMFVDKVAIEKGVFSFKNFVDFLMEHPDVKDNFNVGDFLKFKFQINLEKLKYLNKNIGEVKEIKIDNIEFLGSETKSNFIEMFFYKLKDDEKSKIIKITNNGVDVTKKNVQNNVMHLKKEHSTKRDSFGRVSEDSLSLMKIVLAGLIKEAKIKAESYNKDEYVFVVSSFVQHELVFEQFLKYCDRNKKQINKKSYVDFVQDFLQEFLQEFYKTTKGWSRKILDKVKLSRDFIININNVFKNKGSIEIELDGFVFSNPISKKDFEKIFSLGNIKVLFKGKEIATLEGYSELSDVYEGEIMVGEVEPIDFIKQSLESSVSRDNILDLSKIKKAIEFFKKHEYSDKDEKIFLLIEEFILNKAHEREDKDVHEKRVDGILLNHFTAGLKGVYPSTLFRVINIMKKYNINFLDDNKKEINDMNKVLSKIFEGYPLGMLLPILNYDKETKTLRLNYNNEKLSDEFKSFIFHLMSGLKDIENIELSGEHGILKWFIDSAEVLKDLPLKKIDISDVKLDGRAIGVYSMFCDSIEKINKNRNEGDELYNKKINFQDRMKEILEARLDGMYQKVKESIKDKKNFLEVSNELFETVYQQEGLKEKVETIKEEVFKYLTSFEGVNRGLNYLSRMDPRDKEGIQRAQLFKQRINEEKKSEKFLNEHFKMYIKNFNESEEKVFKFPKKMVFDTNLNDDELLLKFKKTNFYEYFVFPEKVVGKMKPKKIKEFEILFPENTNLSLSFFENLQKELPKHKILNIEIIKARIEEEKEKIRECAGKKDSEKFEIDTDLFQIGCKYKVPDSLYLCSKEEQEHYTSYLAKQSYLSEGKFDLEKHLEFSEFALLNKVDDIIKSAFEEVIILEENEIKSRDSKPYKK